MQIEVNDVSYVYEKDSPFEKKALHNVSLTIENGSFVAIAGQTGSGKSTLVQHLNGLLLPTTGSIKIGDIELHNKTKKKLLKTLRSKVGYVFQSPEQQLFEETVEKEVLFGLQNFGYSPKVAKERAAKALSHVGINEELFQVSPFHLSGGQMRRVAIASILALEPEVLILDEPVAGLDSTGRNQIMELFKQYNKEKEATVILVTHHMEDVANYADTMYIMKNGKLITANKPQEIFYNDELLRDVELDVPETIAFMKKFDNQLNGEQKFNGITINEAANYILSVLQNKE